MIALGGRDAAFAELERAYEKRPDTMAIINFYPLLENLRNDPRFLKIQRQIGKLPR